MRRFAVLVPVVAVIASAVFVPATRVVAAPANGAVSWGGGYNTKGQLGTGDLDAQPAPVDVLGLGPNSGVADVAAGGSHSLTLLDDGTVLAYGLNLFGALGLGTAPNAEVSVLAPTQVTGLGAGSGVVAVAAGDQLSMALKADGTVLAWGNNSKGQVGDGTTVNRGVPTAVGGLTDIVAVAAGFDHSLALRDDGAVFGWGNNLEGMVGDGTLTDRSTPTQVMAPGSGVVQVSAGLYNSYARTDAGLVYAWGNDYYGTLGDGYSGLEMDLADGTRDGEPSGAATTPQIVPGLADAVDVDGGGAASYAVTADGSLYAWGSSSAGRLCNGVESGAAFDQASTTLIGSGSGAVDVDSGWQHVLVRFADGSVQGCGYNANGELGRGIADVSVPVPAEVLGLSAGAGVSDISTGFAHSLVVAESVLPYELPDPPTYTVGVGDVVVREGDAGSRVASITLTLNVPLAVPVTVRVTTTSSTATSSDYTPLINKLVKIPAYKTSTTVNITFFGDGLQDGTEVIEVHLTNPVNVQLLDDDGTITLVGDDQPSSTLPEVSVGDVSVYEGDSGTTKAVFTVSLSQTSTSAVAVRYRTENDSAYPWSDYVNKNLTSLKFAAGTRSKLVAVTVNNDFDAEGDEYFQLLLQEPSGATISDSTGEATIVDDD